MVEIFEKKFLIFFCIFVRKNRRPPLRIAQVSDLAESVPPRNYGSIERIVHYLTEELVGRGHNVTLFASTDSNTSATLVSKWPSYRHHKVDREAAFRWVYGQAVERMDEFDILHIHSDMFLLLGINLSQVPASKMMMTMHWNMENKIYQKLGDFPLISVSNDQRKHALGKPNFIGTVYHGIPPDLLTFVEKAAGEKPYLVFLGRIDQTKRPDWAIQIAVKAGIPLKMAAKVDDYQRDYWQNEIKPMVEQHKDLVEFLGEVNDTQKSRLLGHALAFLFPIDWPEPFGMVLVESMACGTPVIARRGGPVPEEGVSGLLFDSVDEAVQAVKEVGRIDRKGVREAFERRFTARKMADGYEQIYYKRLGIVAN